MRDQLGTAAGRGRGRRTPEEVVLEAAARHELVDEEALLVLAAVAEEADEVGVAELAEEDDLGEPLAVALEAGGVELLDGDGLGGEARAHAGVDEALVDGAEAALAEEEAAGEVVRDAAELAEAERVQLQRALHHLLSLLLLDAAVLVHHHGGATRRRAVGQRREPPEGREPARELRLLRPAPRQPVGGHRRVLRRAALGCRRQHRPPRLGHLGVEGEGMRSGTGRTGSGWMPCRPTEVRWLEWQQAREAWGSYRGAKPRARQGGANANRSNTAQHPQLLRTTPPV